MIEFWNWYSNLFSSSNNLEVIGVWTATLTTAGFIINFVVIPLFKYVRDNFSKLEVEATIKMNFSMSSIIGNKYLPPSLFCIITNQSNEAIFIKAPTIKFSKKVDNSKEFHVLSPSDKYPKKLESGEQFKEEYDLSNLEDSLLKQLNQNDTVRFKILTTKGKKYYSNKIKYEKLTSTLKLSKESVGALGKN